MPPSHVGPYQILGTLGRGGIGTVYRAVDSRSQEEVALKLLSTGAALDPVVAKRLVREFDALAELSHPNIVRVFDAGVYQGYPYLAMELIEGLDLRRYLTLDLADAPQPSVFRRDDPSGAAWDPADDVAPGSSPAFGLDSWLAEPDTDALGSTFPHPRGSSALRAYARQTDEPDTYEGEADEGVPWEPEMTPEESDPEPLPQVSLEELNAPERIGRLKDALVQICEALAYVHARGIIHRDLKPGNILVDEDRRVKLMDFGLAKFLADQGTVTATGKVVGTYRYMAPEQGLGEAVDGRADLYSLGVIVYELLAGRPPYDARTPVELFQEVLEREPASLFGLNPDVDSVLARVAHRLLRKDPDERYQTAEEVFEVLLAG